jgi:hypothetical protein
LWVKNLKKYGFCMLIAAKVRKYELLLWVKEIKQGYEIYLID